MTGAEARVINVLLVEDDPGDVLMTREAFDEYLHNRLDVVTDGAAALAYLRSGVHPDLFLLDYSLGGEMNGLDLLVEARAQGIHVPAVLMTATPVRDPSAPYLARLRIMQVLAKPFEIDALHRAIARCGVRARV